MKKKFIALSMLMFASSSHYMTGMHSVETTVGSKPTERTSAPIKTTSMFSGWNLLRRNSEPEITPLEKRLTQSEDARPPQTEDARLNQGNEQVSNEPISENQAVNVDVNYPEPESQATSSQTNLQRLNQQLNSVARSAYQNIASLRTPTGRQAFIDSVSAMFTNAGRSVPSTASFRAFFSSITPNMSMPDFMGLFNRFFAKSAEAPGAEAPGAEAPVENYQGIDLKATASNQVVLFNPAQAPEEYQGRNLKSTANNQVVLFNPGKEIVDNATTIQSAWRRNQARKKAAELKDAQASSIAPAEQVVDANTNNSPGNNSANSSNASQEL